MIERRGFEMNVKNLVVADLISVMDVLSTSITCLESGTIIGDKICRKEKGGYRDLETNHFYSEKQKTGLDRVEEGSIVPLSQYYNAFGFPKLRGPENRKDIHQKVKKLRREGKL